MVARTSLIVIALAACGSNDVRHIVDAPFGDDDDASFFPDGPAALVSLTVTIGGVPDPGITVYFESFDQTIMSTAMTDATGTATGAVGVVGYVTMAIPAPPVVVAATEDRLVTWSGVLGGDHLLFDAAGGATTVTFEIPVDSTRKPASYAVSTTCGNGTIPMPVTTAAPPTQLSQAIGLTGCSGPQDVLVVGLDGSGAAVSSFEVPQQTLTNNGTLDLTSQTYTAAQSRTYTWSNDVDIETLEMQDTLESLAGSVYQSQQVAAAGTPPTITRTAPVFGTYKDVVQARMLVSTTQHEMDEWGQAAMYSGNWGANRLPDFTSAPAYDGVSQVSWNTTGGTIQPNISELLIAASRPSDQNHTWEWVVLSDPGPVTLPTLPTTIYNWNIQTTDTFSANVAVANVPGIAAQARAVLLGPAGTAAVETGATGVLSTASYDVEPQPAVVRRLRLPFFRR